MGIPQQKGGKAIDLYCYIKVLKVKPVYQQMTLSPKLGVVGISTLWHFRLPLPIHMFIKVASSPRPSGIGMPSPILWSHPLKMQKIVLLSSLLWLELGTNSLITGPGEWLSFWRFTSKLSWSWSWPLWDQQGLLSFQWFMLQGGARGQYLGHHRFCLMSWRLVDGWILYLRCLFSVTQTLTWIYVYRPVTYISWSSDFALCLEDYLLDESHNWYIGSVWCKGDLHFMVQWFCLMSWRLFDGLMLYWR